MARWLARWFAVAAVLSLLGACGGRAPAAPAPPAVATGELHQQRYLQELYDDPATRELVGLVNDAARRVQARGEAAFDEFRVPGSRWRQQETYIFVLDPVGTVLVRIDPTMENRSQLGLKDVNGKPIIRGLIAEATAVPGKTDGWYHYEWPVPGAILPRWKSSYVKLVTTPSGKPYVVGSGMYNDRMERAFVIDMVRDAVGLVERTGEAAFPRLRDETGPFIAKDAYVFVIDPNGVDVVNPAFPNLEGRSLRDVKDTRGKHPIREMLELARTRGAGWVDYMWPKPGQSVSTKKSAYVQRANLNGTWLLVGSGVYLADAPKEPATSKRARTAPELMGFVREAARVLEKQGDKAYPELRRRGSRWFPDDTYLFVWTLDGTRTMHAADPSLEGRDGSTTKDVLGRPYGRMMLDAARGGPGEGWVHYMFPEPAALFPAWKSTFVKRVTFPSGAQHLVGAGVYAMQMDRAFIEDIVGRASALVEARGREAFAQLRDETGPFVFMDTYVFVDAPDGTELVNPAQPSLEGRNLLGMRDAAGKLSAREYIETAMKDGSGWAEYTWYKPGDDTPARKHTFVRKVQHGPETYVVGSGYYAN